MSDFGELCPLFNTGVFSEVTFPGPIGLSSIGTLENLLVGTSDQARTALGYFTFGRTVVVTEAFIQRLVTNTDGVATLHLRHKSSGTQQVSGTIIAQLTLAATGSSHQPPGWRPFIPFTGKTFTSDEVLALCMLSCNTVDEGNIGFMVRYKEK
jgi:hypothetical protein